MKNKKFSIRRAFSFGWETFKTNPRFFIGLALIVILIQFVPEMISRITRENAGLSFFTAIAFFALQLIINMGIIKITLSFYDEKSAKTEDLFCCTSYVFRYFFATALYSIIALLGLVLLIVPGIILGIRLRFYDYFIVDKDMRPIDSLKASWKATQGEGWNIFFFMVLAGLLNLAGILALLVGSVVAIPVASLANAYVYRKLVHKDVEEEPKKLEIVGKPAVIDNVSIMV